MIGTGMLLSEYIKKLEELKKKHGDVECFTDGGSDYPGPAEGPHFTSKGNAYVHKKSVILG